MPSNASTRLFRALACTSTLALLASACLDKLETLATAPIDCSGSLLCPTGLECRPLPDGRQYCLLAGISVEAPESISPSAGATLSTGPVEFTWAPVTGVPGYVLTVARDSTLESPLSSFPRRVSGTSVTVQLDNSGVYFWSVRRSDSPLTSEIRNLAVFDDTLYVYCPAGESCEPGQSGSEGSRERPTPSLSRAIALAGIVNASTIAVAGRGSGEAYEEPIQLLRPVQIVGGYSPDFSERDPELYPTEMRTEAPVPALVYATEAPVLLDGLRLSGIGSELESVLVLRFASDVELRDVTVSFAPSNHDLTRVPDQLHGVLIEDSSVIARRLRVNMSTTATAELKPGHRGITSERSALDLEDSLVVLEGQGASIGVSSRTGGSLALRGSEVQVVLPDDLQDEARSQTGVYCQASDCTIQDSLILGGVAGLRVSSAPNALVERNVIGTRGCAVVDSAPFFFRRTCSGVDVTMSCEPGEFFTLQNNVVFAEGDYAVALNLGRPIEPQTIVHNTFIANGTQMSAGVLLDQNPRADFANNVIHASPAPTAACFVYESWPNFRPGPTSLRNNLFSCATAMHSVTNGGSIDGTESSFEDLMGRDGTQFDDQVCSDVGTTQSYRYEGNLRVTGLGADEVIRDRVDGDWRVVSSLVDTIDDAGIDSSLELCGSDEAPRDCGAVVDSIDGSPRTVPVSIGAHEYD